MLSVLGPWAWKVNSNTVFTPVFSWASKVTPSFGSELLRYAIRKLAPFWHPNQKWNYKRMSFAPTRFRRIPSTTSTCFKIWLVPCIVSLSFDFCFTTLLNPSSGLNWMARFRSNERTIMDTDLKTPLTKIVIDTAIFLGQISSVQPGKGAIEVKRLWSQTSETRSDHNTGSPCPTLCDKCVGT